jgi:hypothetical protein
MNRSSVQRFLFLLRMRGMRLMALMLWLDGYLVRNLRSDACRDVCDVSASVQAVQRWAGLTV